MGAHSDTGTEMGAKVNVPLILGPGPGHTGPSFIVQDGSGHQFTMPSARFTSGGAPVNLGSGFTFTTYQATGRTDQYPEVLWVTPTPGAVNVPTQLYLELGFSHPMDKAEVQKSKLRITQTGGGSFTIPIQEAINNNWVSVTWSGTGKKKKNKKNKEKKKKKANTIKKKKIAKQD